MRFNVGDVVRVLYRDEMVRDRGARICDNDHSLRVPYPEDASRRALTFNTNMNQYCGQEYVIEKISANGHEYFLKGISAYVFNDNMVDVPFIFVDFDASKIDEFLRGVACEV